LRSSSPNILKRTGPDRSHVDTDRNARPPPVLFPPAPAGIFVAVGQVVFCGSRFVSLLGSSQRPPTGLLVADGVKYHAAAPLRHLDGFRARVCVRKDCPRRPLDQGSSRGRHHNRGWSPGRPAGGVASVSCFARIINCVVDGGCPPPARVAQKSGSRNLPVSGRECLGRLAADRQKVHHETLHLCRGRSTLNRKLFRRGPARNLMRSRNAVLEVSSNHADTQGQIRTGD